MATAAIVFAALSYFCLGPVGALGGVVCALIGYREIRESEGRMGGKELCTVALVLSAANLVLTAATVAVFAFGITSTLRKATAVSGSPTYTAPYATSTPPPPTSGPRSSRGGEAGQTTPLDVVTEVRLGRVTLVDLPPTGRPLAVELRAQQGKASAAHERMVLFIVTASCRPCMSVAAVLNDRKMQAALDQVRLVRINAHDAPEELNALGVATGTIPGFYVLRPNLKVADGITGAEWDDDTADNIAPVIRAFLKGTYAKRRRPYESPADEEDPPRRPPGGVDL